jgi:hypothetical protein
MYSIQKSNWWSDNMCSCIRYTSYAVAHTWVASRLDNFLWKLLAIQSLVEGQRCIVCKIIHHQESKIVFKPSNYSICHGSRIVGWTHFVDSWYLVQYTFILLIVTVCPPPCCYHIVGFPSAQILFLCRFVGTKVLCSPFIKWSNTCHTLLHAQSSFNLTSISPVIFFSWVYYRCFQDNLKLMDDLAALRPTVFASVPRLYNRIYSA